MKVIYAKAIHEYLLPDLFLLIQRLNITDLVMTLIICPGIHHRTLTSDFINILHEYNLLTIENSLIFPSHEYPPYWGYLIKQFLEQQLNNNKHQELTFIAFSAGVVGAIKAAWSWQNEGGKIKAFIALDGWGVPLLGNFPIYRLSHDFFTHWSSAILGSGTSSFYADPPVEHLDLWRSPHEVLGWQIGKQPKTINTATRTSAIAFLAPIIKV